MASWKERHLAAMSAPVSAAEFEIVEMLNSIARLVAQHHEFKVKYHNDYVLEEAANFTAEAVNSLASAVLVLLNGETGRLDASSVDTHVRSYVETVGLDPDRI